LEGGRNLCPLFCVKSGARWSGRPVQLTVLVHTEPRVFCRSLSYGVWPPRAPCDHCGDGSPNVPDTIEAQGELPDRTRIGEQVWKRRHVTEICACYDRQHSLGTPGRVRAYLRDPRVGERATNDRYLRHPRQQDVGDEPTLSRQEPIILLHTWHRDADQGGPGRSLGVPGWEPNITSPVTLGLTSPDSVL
jgi:hypothetical protein